MAMVLKGVSIVTAIFFLFASSSQFFERLNPLMVVENELERINEAIEMNMRNYDKTRKIMNSYANLDGLLLQLSVLK